jgi:hypothetical protein
MTKHPETGKRIQVYLAARHREWWDKLPRYERSRVVAEALDLYRAEERNSPDNSPDRQQQPPNSAD